MSLDFDVSKVKNFDVLTSIPDPYGRNKEDGTPKLSWHPVTNALIWATISVGMSSITEKNWIEFFQRVRAVERVSGAYVNRPNVSGAFDPKGFITPLEVYSHIGLHTNASSKTLAKFREDLYSLSCRETPHQVFEAIPEKYKELGLENASKEEWFGFWNKEDEGKDPTVDLRFDHFKSDQKLLELAEEKHVSQ